MLFGPVAQREPIVSVPDTLHPSRSVNEGKQAHVVIIVFTSAAAAYGASAELKRLYTAQTWGEIDVRRVGDHAEMTLPPHSWRDPQLREIIRRFGGVQAG
jgi:hypothetical protein